MSKPGLWTRWKALLARQETGEAQAVFRILVGIGAFWIIMMPARFDVWRLVWTNEGYLPHAPDPQTVMMVMAAGALAAVCLIVGVAGRVAALVALQACIWLFDINPPDNGAHDRYVKNALWLLVICGGTASWSLQCRLQTGSWRSDRLVSSWPRYVAILQLVLTYWATGVQKVGLEWTPFGDFTALWYILKSPLYLRFDAGWMPFGFTQLSTAMTWIWEWGAPVWLYAFWCRDKRPPTHWANRIDLRTLWAAWGLGMHSILFSMTALGPLQWATASWYAALYHPDEYRRMVAWIRGKLRR